MPPREKSKKNVPALYNNKNAQKWSYAKAEALFNEMIDWFIGSDIDSMQVKHDELKNVFISVFLASKRLHKSTLDYLIAKYDKKGKLAELKEIAFTMQEARLLDYGFKDVGNAKFAEFILKNNHDYKEKVQNEHSGEIKTPERENVGDESLKALGLAFVKAAKDDSE